MNRIIAATAALAATLALVGSIPASAATARKSTPCPTVARDVSTLPRPTLGEVALTFGCRGGGRVVMHHAPKKTVDMRHR